MTEESKSKTEWIYCNRCRGKTLHRLTGTTEGGGAEEETGYWWSFVFQMLQCCGCEEVVLRRISSFSEDPETDVRYFPPVMSRYLPQWRFDLPKDSRLLLEEIYRSLDSASLRLPMLGARTLVDMMILEKVGDVGTFKDKLDELEKQGIVSTQNREVLFVALDMGSAAAHRGYAATESEVEAIMDIVENMLQAVYVFPGVAEKLKEATPPRPPRKPKNP
jgi:Domain of unknown function (DUF4145)